MFTVSVLTSIGINKRSSQHYVPFLFFTWGLQVPGYDATLHHNQSVFVQITYTYLQFI